MIQYKLRHYDKDNTRETLEQEGGQSIEEEETHFLGGFREEDTIVGDDSDRVAPDTGETCKMSDRINMYTYTVSFEM